MSTDRDPTRIIRSWLRSDEHVSADRILDVVLSIVDTTPQRRHAWLARRSPFMSNSVRIALAATAVVVAALIGYQLLISPNVSGPGPAPSPSSTMVPTPTPAAFSDQPFAEALAPGSYVITHVSPFRITITVPSGWYKGRYDWALFADADNSSINFGTVDNLYTDPCQIGLGLRDPAVGPTVADLVTALGTLPGVETGPPSDVTVAGHTGQLIEVTGPPTERCLDEPRLWQMNSGDFMPAPGPTGYVQVWILDVDGTRLVIATYIRPDVTADTLAELEAMVDSLQIGFP